MKRMLTHLKTDKKVRQLQSFLDITEEEWIAFKVKLIYEDKTIKAFITEKIKEYIK